MNKRAFTLVELLAVIFIIGILAAILIPVAGAVQSSARNNRCLGNLKAIAQAAHLWMADNRGHMPDAEGWRAVDTNTYSIRPYLSISGGNAFTAFTCPEAHRLHPNPDAGLSDNLRTYSINLYACRTQNGDTGHSNVSSNPGLITRVLRPAEMAFFMDGDLLSATTGVRQYVHSSMTNPANLWTTDKPYGLLAVHKGKLNIAFVDGHVESRDPALLPSNAASGGPTQAQRTPFWGRFQ